MRVHEKIRKPKGIIKILENLGYNTSVFKTHQHGRIGRGQLATTHKIKGRIHIHTTFLFENTNDDTKARELTQRECSCRGRFIDLRKCSSQAF